jgi:hypothetical protein
MCYSLQLSELRKTSVYPSMQILLLCFVILTASTTTNTQDVSHTADSSVSNVQIAVPYTLWNGTDVSNSSSITIQARTNTPFLDVMIEAARQDWSVYR